MSHQNSDITPSVIVGIGASAGGLAVLKRFVSSIPVDSGLAFVVVQHLDPSHDSMLAELLDRETSICVKHAEDGEEVRANVVYVIPQDTYLELRRGKLALVEAQDSKGKRAAIDHLFRSMAEERQDRCAGVILSGAGSDGTAGLRAIKAAGGLALVQDPEEADHPGMPDSALRANAADKIVPIEDMPGILMDYAAHPMSLRESWEEEGEETDPGNEPDAQMSLGEVTAILKSNSDFDLSQYKPGTVQRRIARRMSSIGIQEYSDYLEELRESESERENLSQDLLINVTDFFRDKKAYEHLEKVVFPAIVEKLGKKEDLRIWVPGCASGEEAYSLAILAAEALSKARKRNKVKIFATDIDHNAIKIARKAVYPDSIAREVPAAFLDRYFAKAHGEHYYKVRGFLRDTISFATQNVAGDPPFNHMHLISCRNLLIYLTRETQEHVLASFYFALDDPAYLFLGSSESLGNQGVLFRTESKKWRIYQKIPGRTGHRATLGRLHVKRLERDRGGDRSHNGPRPKARNSESIPRPDRIRLSLMEAATPPSMMIDENGRLLYSHGDLSSYTTFPSGEPRNEIIQYLRPSLRTRVRSGLIKVRRTNERASLRCLLDTKGSADERGRVVNVELLPLGDQEYADGSVVCLVFREEETINDSEREALNKANESSARELEQELTETKLELQNTVEELESSTEELKAAHEEALSTNEELQSSNEELEASAEELRSLNEELSTVNSQLKEKIDELHRATNDVQNFFASTNLPTVFLNPDLCVERYSEAAENLLRMGPPDVGRRIVSLGRDLLDNDLEEECRSVLHNFQPVRSERQDGKGRWFVRQITPYRTEDRRIEGVVLVFQDITELRELHKRAEGRERQQSVVAQLGLLALTGVDPEELMHQAVRQVAHTLDADLCKLLKYLPDEKELVMVAGVGWRPGLVGKARVSSDQNSQAGYTLSAKEPVIVSQLDDEKRFSGPKLLTDHGVVSGISCVINHSQPPFGVIGVHTTKRREFSQEDATFLQSVANMLSTAVRTREAGNRLHESEERFRSLANSIPQLAWRTDETGSIDWYNERWYEYTGSNFDEMKGWGWQKLHHPDHIERVTDHFKNQLSLQKEWEDTFPLLSKKGEYRWFLSRATPIRDSEGRIVHWFGTNTDITDKLEREAALQQSEDRLRLAKDSGRLGLFDYDVNKGHIEWEPLLSEIWGLDKDEPVTLEAFYDGLHPDDVEKTEQAIQASTDPQGDGHYSVVYRVINRATGAQHHVKASGITQFQDGKPVRMIGLVGDITEEENTRRRLAASEESLRFTLESNHIGVWEMDFATQEAVRTIEHDRIFGYDELQSSWSYERFMEHVHPEDRERVAASFASVSETELWDFECRIQTAKNEVRWIWAVGRLTRNKSNEPNRMKGLVLDITKRKDLESSLGRAIEELQETDARKNEFLSILGHELRNPLAALSYGLSFLENADGSTEEVLGLMRHSVTSMAKLLDDLLDLRRVTKDSVLIEKTPLDLSSVLKNVIRSTKGRFDEKHQKLKVDLAEGLCLEADQVRLEQVFSNLMVNASKFTPTGGFISLRSERVANEILVEVTDDGAGLLPEDLEKVFDPFYQVKNEGSANSGLGIGLALCNKLVTLHGGSIQAHSEGKKKGATFEVRLPAATRLNWEAREATSEQKSASVRAGLKVLIIEDNESILLTLPRQIRDLGCVVETARTASEGLERTGVFGPDAILVDIGLPDMTGHEVASELRSRGFKNLLVAVSGYSHEESRAKSKDVGFDYHLAKPASIGDLAKVLAEA
ncbi:chemotaxis protein CheB [Pelagicoccus sp. SDUM812002]|uniref:chemotaxis protein CheB n=1 Tax=Pelagicoccus sp. SDUM812002 TaxID=3041266 RepID=UPI0028102EE5|nr:chemotaxis protein CheB [Pelagicoccus sp. SDUM812002]MDQ8186013.1 chemotaxis protein CheB [Pelagicoccus sp. SDUM812002]